MTTLTAYGELHAAVVALASVCDGARTDDRQGFNGTDAKFGHRIAAISADEWTRGQAVEVSEMLPKYAGQLARFGIDSLTLPYVTGERDVNARQDARRKVQGTPYAVVTGGQVKVFNSFGVKDRLKPLGFRFSGWDKAWEAPLSHATAAVLVELNVELRDGADDIRSTAGQAPDAAATPKGTVTYDARNDLIHVVAPYDAALVADLKKLPGRQWGGQDNRDLNTCQPAPVVLDVAQRHNLDVSPEAYTAITSAVARLAASSATEVDNYAGALAGTLRAYQQAGTQYALDNPHSINADDMGLGKTLQAIAAAETKGEFPVLVTCPASLRANWVREVGKWTPHRTAEIWDGKGDAPAADYVIVSYEAMTKAVRG